MAANIRSAKHCPLVIIRLHWFGIRDKSFPKEERFVSTRMVTNIKNDREYPQRETLPVGDHSFTLVWNS
jgi:hypothetical protein